MSANKKKIESFKRKLKMEETMKREEAFKKQKKILRENVVKSSVLKKSLYEYTDIPKDIKQNMVKE